MYEQLIKDTDTYIYRKCQYYKLDFGNAKQLIEAMEEWKLRELATSTEIRLLNEIIKGIKEE